MKQNPTITERWLKPCLHRILPLVASCCAALSMNAQATPLLRITEVMSNGDSVGGTATDWFELTNYGDTSATITGYQMDDNSFANVSTSVALSGVTTIAPGESVVFIENAGGTNVAGFKTNWGLGAGVQVGYYSGSGVSLGSGGDGVTVFTNTSANSGTELPGPFGGLIRVSFGTATAGKSFNWTYDPTTGGSTSAAAGQITTSGTTWNNAGTTMLGTPRAAPATSVTIDDVTTTEGDAGAKTLTFTVTRSDAVGAFSVAYATANNTATAGSDYVSASGTLSFTASGALTQTVAITINGDSTVESDESFFVNLSNIVNTAGTAVIGDAQGIGTIANDDPVAPAFTLQPASQSVSVGASASLTVTVSGFPTPSLQWYLGASGDTANPIGGETSATYATPALFANASYWVRASNAGGSADSNTAVMTVSYLAAYGSTNRNILAPNTAAWSPAGVTVNGTTFVNLGLQGVGRVAASTKDPVTGESLGSISDMQITGWKKNSNGTYSGTLQTLPDRGYNSGVIFSNYAARINAFDFTFTPYTSSSSTTAQDQIALTFTGSSRFTYDNGSGQKFTTGTLADGTASLFGTTVPVTTGNSTQSDGTVANRLTLDSEGLVLDKRAGKGGQGWIGDEYGASIYHFNSSKQIDGQLILPSVYVPHSPVGTTNFSGTPVNGRRDNQGMEGIAQSPDGSKLFGLMQSALVHDSLTGNQGRFNTRLLVYDISSTDTPTDPIAQYVIQLPVADDTGSTTNGTTVNRNCAQSSIVALNDHQLLILSRDGNGRGNTGAPVFKSILLADLNSATNIDGTYDAEGNTVISSGALNVAITPLTWSEALNMIGKLGTSTIAEVAKFGLNLNTAPGDINTICEKWEALSLVSANDPANPNDYFLFIGNDNDFITGSGKYLDAAGTLQSYDAGLENDTLVLAYRVRMTGTDNQAPFVANNIAAQNATEGSAFSFTVAADIFADPESQTLTYTATQSDDSALPAWLSFNAATRTFSGTPALANIGTVNVKVTATDSGTPALSGSATFSITVSAAPASFAFASASSSVLESAGSVTLTINRSGGMSAASINVSTTDGTAIAGTDYSAQSNVAVSFAANQASATIDIPVTNRSGINASRVFTAALSGGTTTAPAATTVTITDSESSFAFSASTASVSEAAGSVTLTINRAGRTDNATDVLVSTANGSGIAGTDYTAQSNVSVHFNASATSGTISIPVINRPGIRASRTFNASLGLIAGGTLLGTPATATVTITEADSYASMTGASSSKTPYIQALASNWQVTSLLSAGDQVTPTANPGNSPLISGKYEMAGIPDGVGAFDNGDGTFTMLVHHEHNNTQGVTRAHGSIGGFISEWIINKSTLQVVSGSDLIREVYGWDSANQVSNSTPGTFTFNRFCSADLPAPSALYNAATGLGSQQRIFLGGDESGSNGYAVASVASGANKGKSYILGKFNLTTSGSGLTGVGGWENLLANPYPQDKTVVIGNNDGGTGIMANAVVVYQGTKTNSGTEADKAGLTNGTLKFVNVTGNTAEIINTTTRATNITSGTTFTLSATASTTFSRPEDGAWDPSNPSKFYFVTTDRLDQVADGISAQVGRTRLWRLNFTDITNPDLGGTIDLLIEGGGTLPVANDANMFDNITVTNDGKVVLCEDVGGAPHNGKVWFYDPVTTSLTKIIKHDISRFGDVVSGTVTAATLPFTNDEETSGVIDVTHIFGGNAATGERTYLIVDQAHYTTGITAAQVEGGQLLLLKQASTFLGIAAGDADSSSATLWAGYNKTTTGASINVQVATDSVFITPTTLAGSTPTAANGWTTKVNVTGLSAATNYFYRFVEVATGEVSATGKFKTAPAVSSAVAVRFAFSGDNDGIMRPYPLASTVAAQNLDFYVNLGDTIYENASASLGNNGASWLNSPSVTTSGASNTTSPSSTGATLAQLAADYAKKYRENFLPVNIGGQNALKDFYAAQGNYTQFDNHELGNRQYINGGAPRGGAVGDMSSGAGVNSSNTANDVNTSTSGDYMNKAPGFQTLIDTYLNWMPVKADRAGGSGLISAPSDSRTDGTHQFYFGQQWGKNAVYINADDRSYRDIRLKTAGNVDDTGSRAANANRTMLGATQLAWIKQQLLAAQTAGVPWKFVAVSDPIDQLGPIGGALTGSITTVNADGGKSWIGGYRAERNALLKYIADNHITNVVFLATDDHQNRINELTYSPTDTENQATYIKVPYCFSIVCGPLGATGPETITNHTFSNIKTIADDLATRQAAAGLEPIGLMGYPGLKNLMREGDATAGSSPQAVDFYSPDTFNYTVFDVSADGKTLTVTSKGINAFAQNAALEYDAANNPVRDVFSFQVDAVSSNADLAALTGIATTPAFDAATTSYTANVGGNVTSLTLTPGSSDAGATITVNGNALVAGSATVPLTVGSNPITLLVTAADGNTKTYNIAVTRAAAPTFNFATATATVSEAAGNAVLSITRGGDTAVAVSVNVSTADSTGIAGTDYTAVTAQTVSFAANATTATVNVPVINRPGIRSNRNFTATLTASSAGTVIGTPATVTVTITEADTFAASTGPSSSATPYVLPLNGNWQTRSILSVGDSIGGYQMAGIPDGLGAFDNGDGTFTLLVNHEHGNGVGVLRAHGAKGAFVSQWVINKSTLAVTSGSDLMTSLYNWNTGTQSSNATTSAIALNRFCSADLPPVSAFYNSATGLGTQERLFMNGEEGGSTGFAIAHVATGTSKGSSYILGKFNLTTNGSGLTGLGAWENLLANPLAQNKTVVIGTNDGGTGIMANSVAVYVGTKTNTGTEADKAGLTNGTLKFINVTGNTAEIVNTTTRATNITNGTAFTLSATASTTFSRPEDGAWNPLNPNQFYFVTTDQLDTVRDGLGATVGHTRLWRLTFTDITNPDLGGTIDLLIEGGTGAVGAATTPFSNDANMFDNLTVTSDGKLMLQEDVGNAAHNGKVWFFDPVASTLTKVLKHDTARFGDVGLAATAPFTQDEETSGIIDVTALLGGNTATGERFYLTSDQAHYTTGISTANVEGGQLLLVHQFGSVTGPSTATSPYLIPTDPSIQVSSILTVGDSIGGYEMAGIPDGLGAFDNGDGTFTLLVNHEHGNGVGVVRAHGAKGAFVSQWVINKSTLTVTSGSDLMTSLYNWNTSTQSSNATTSAIALNRFCSADLPAVSAFYNSATGLGTQERLFMNGEEGGSTGYAIAHVATGANKGSSFILGKFNLTTNGSGLTGIGAWENLLANPLAQDKTVVIGTNDGGTGIMANSVAVYVGTKTNAGTEADKAGLTNGTLKFINVTGSTAEIVNTTTRATNISSGTAFTLSATASTTFSRPEDGAWDPTNVNRFYFVTTDQLDTVNDGLGATIGRTRLWRLNFTDITNPDLGGTIDLVLTGGTGGNDANMWDNITVTNDGKLLLQEDVGNAAHNGKVWFYDPTTGVLKKVIQHDPARFGDVTTPATAPFTADEETSGIIDVTTIFGGSVAAGQRIFLTSDQAHYTTGISTANVEGGQLLLVRQTPPLAFSLAAATNNVQEDAGNLTLTVNRFGDLQFAGSVQVSTTDGTAVAGTDYTALTSFAVNFAAGESTKTVNVPVTYRSGIQASRSFTAALVNPSTGAVLGGPNSTTVTINDADSIFALAAATATVSEAAGSVVLTIDRTGKTDVANTVNVSTTDGTGVAGTDYTALVNSPVAFAIGQTSKTVSISVVNRPGIRASRTFSAALSVAGVPLSVGSPSSATVTITEADTLAAMTGPSSSATPYIRGLDSSTFITSILTTGDSIGGYQMAGIPDGLGAFDNGDGTFTLLMNHEHGNGVGSVRAHGAIGAFVSAWVINKTTLQVLSGSDLMQQVYNWNTGTQSSNGTTSTIAFNRFCSADLSAVSAFYNSATGLGTQERLFMDGEEGGSTGYAIAHVATGANKGKSYILGKFNLTTNGSGLTGLGAWENLLANPMAQDKTVVIGNNDGGTGIMANSVAVYVGTKTNTGTEADKAGLTNGTLKFINVTGNTAEIVNTTSRATNITSGTAFTLSATASTTFSRPEDGAWNPLNPNQFYFVTTDQLDTVRDGLGAAVGHTRLWRLTFTDITNPDLGGTIDLLVEGGTGAVGAATSPFSNDANMFDNLSVSADGKLMLEEDVGNAAHNGKIWFYNPATGSLTKLIKSDAARFGDVGTAATSPFTQDEENSGIIDVTALLGGNAFTGDRLWLNVTQAHYSLSAPLVEGGQLQLIRQSSPLSTPFLGVASGDADTTSATLWTRYNNASAATITALVSTNSAFTGTPLTFLSGAPSAANDWTSKVRATGLTPGTTYFYCFYVAATGEFSGIGMFKTAPVSSSSAPLHFAFSGDNDGLMRPYPLASTIPAQGLDFYVNLGDTIYENASNVSGNNSGTWLNSPSVTLSGSSASLNGVPTSTGFATAAQLKADYEKKYRENFFPVNIGGQNSLKDLYAAQSNFTTWDNHELGNRQYINGGAPAGGSIGGALGTDMTTGRGVDARNNVGDNVGNVNDVNNSASDYMNRSTGFQTLRDVFLNYMPIADRAPISAPSDPRTDGSKQLYNAQQWGRNALFLNTDTRSYRDLRLKTANGAADDTTAPRANNAGRTMFGATQLAWVKQQLIDAQTAGVTWKFVSVSDPIDQLGPIGGALSGVTNTTMLPYSGNSSYGPVSADGGKSFIGGYRAERNALLKYIADNHITNVVFLATDDHQNRINEITYSPTDSENQSSYVKVPYCFSIVTGPLGATGPDLFVNHGFSSVKGAADLIAGAQTTAGVEPLGLVGYPGLKNLVREGDATAGTNPQPADFYSPDTFNYTVLDVSADGKTLTVTNKGINSWAQNAALEYDASTNPVRNVFTFQIDAPSALDLWRQTYLGSVNNSGTVANTADFDGDSIPNLMEYALGINPASIAGANGPSALPAGVINDANSLLADRLAISFTIDTASPSDVTYTVQATSDLVNWTDVARKVGLGEWGWLTSGTTSRIVLTPSGSRTNVKVGDIVPADAANPRRMMRLRVTTP